MPGVSGTRGRRGTARKLQRLPRLCAYKWNFHPLIISLFCPNNLRFILVPLRAFPSVQGVIRTWIFGAGGFGVRLSRALPTDKNSIIFVCGRATIIPDLNPEFYHLCTVHYLVFAELMALPWLCPYLLPFRIGFLFPEPVRYDKAIPFCSCLLREYKLLLTITI